MVSFEIVFKLLLLIGDIGIALQRILERGIVVSKAVDLEELCIRVSERVWKISVHVHILSHDGNLLDCACIAAITALAHFRRPDVSVVGKVGLVL